MAMIIHVEELKDQEKIICDTEEPKMPNYADFKDDVRCCLDEIDHTLNHILGGSGVPLNYVIQPTENFDPNRIYQNSETWIMMVDHAPLNGINFVTDNNRVYSLIREVFQGTLCEGWMNEHHTTRNGRGAFLSIMNRYVGSRPLL